MIGAAAAYMSGLFFASFFTEGSDFLLLAGSIPLFCIVGRYFLKLTSGTVLTIAIAFSAAFTAFQLHTHLYCESVTEFAGQTCSYSGEIIDFKEHDGGYATYTLSGTINGTQRAKLSLFAESRSANIGDTVVLESVVPELHGSDYLFDGQTYYKSKNIFLTAANCDISEIRHNGTHKLRNRLADFREQMICGFYSETDPETGAFLTGMVFGDNSDMEDSDKTLLYRCGIGHVMAVSGLHISLIVILIMTIMRGLGAGKYLSFAVMDVFLVLMIILVESPITAVRAAIMLNIMYSARLFLRQNDPLNSLSAAVLVICIMNPYVIYDAGFMLSISGTFGIAVFGPYMTKDLSEETFIKRIFKNFLIMIFVSMCLMPVNLYYFDEVSLISPITNIFVVGFCIAAMIAGLLYVFTFGHFPLIILAKPCTEVVRAVSGFLGRIRLVKLSAIDERLAVFAAICAFAVIAIYALMRSRKTVALALAAVTVIFFTASVLYTRSRLERFTVSILGKGSDCAVVIHDSGSVIVCDMSGDHRTPEYVRRYLTQIGADSVDALIVTQKQASQTVAYEYVLDLFDIKRTLTDEAIPTVSAESSNGDAIVVEAFDFRAEYSDRILQVSCGEFTIRIMPSKIFIGSEADVTVLYGYSSTAYADSADGTVISLSKTYGGINNFEIIPSKNGGEFDIRRL